MFLTLSALDSYAQFLPAHLVKVQVLYQYLYCSVLAKKSVAAYLSHVWSRQLVKSLEASGQGTNNFCHSWLVSEACRKLQDLLLSCNQCLLTRGALGVQRQSHLQLVSTETVFLPCPRCKA